MKRSMAAFLFVALITASCGGRLLEGDLGSRGAGTAGDAGGTGAADAQNQTPAPASSDARAPGKDASAFSDAAASSPGNVVCNFGATVCDAKQGEQCCVLIETGKIIGASCVTGECTPGAGQFGESFACDGPEDCANGSICCAYRGGSAACAKSETCDLNSDHVQLCHTQNDCQALPGTTCCPEPESVVPSGTCRSSCN